MNIKQFEFQYRRLFMPLCMYALRLLGDEDEAKDLVQESFLSTWRVLEEGREIEALKSFLYTTVRNGALMRLRSARHTEPIEDIPEISEETIDTAERDARLWKAIDKLPEGCRRVFLLSKRDGLSNSEIAEELGISVKTVENQMTKAFRTLRGDLSGKVFFLPFL